MAVFPGRSVKDSSRFAPPELVRREKALRITSSLAYLDGIGAGHWGPSSSQEFVKCVRIKSMSITAGLTAGMAALAVVLSGCGGGSGGRVSPVAGGAASSAASSGSSSAVVVQAGQGARLSAVVSGSQLWDWEPSNEYPADLSEVSGAPYSSGAATTPTNTYRIASQTCDALLSSEGGPGYGETAYVYDQGDNAAGTVVYAYAAYGFATADQASAYVQALAAKFVSCGTFTESSQGQTLTVTMSLGDRSEAAAIPSADTAVDLREKVALTGKTVSADLLVAADGNVVVVEESSAPSDTLPTEVNLSKVAQDTFAAFAQGEASGSAGAAGGAAGASSGPEAPVSPDAGDVARIGGLR